MKILQVIPSVSRTQGGTTTAIEMIERSLAAVCLSITTATTDDDGRGRRLRKTAQVKNVNGATRFYANKRFEFYKVAPSLIPWLWLHIREFDVVHIHGVFSFTSIAAAIVARWRDVPYVLSPHGMLMSYGILQRRPWLKRLSLALLDGHVLRSAEAVLFTSQAELDESELLGIPFNSIVIPLGVEIGQKGKIDDLRVEDGELSGRFVVCYLSRLDRKKNVEGLLRAYAELNPKAVNAVLLIGGAGDPPYVASLKSLAESLHISKYVQWLGHVEGAHKASLLAKSDVFVLPSYSENFGIAVVEALSAGLPCVLGRGVAIAAEVQLAGAGLIVDPEVESIAHALKTLKADGPKRNSMAAKARSFAETYSPEVMANRYQALYQRIFDARCGSPRARVLSQSEG